MELLTEVRELILSARRNASHSIDIIQVITNFEIGRKRSFYEIEASANAWSLPELRRQYDSGLYERLALSRDKEAIRKLACEGQ